MAQQPAEAAASVEGDGTAGTMSSDRCHRFGTYADCPMCGGSLHAEHAHFKCGSCGWRDSCCD